MLLKVGPFVYRVVLVEGYIDHEGEPCLGLCDNETHELFVSDRCSVAQQVQVISHEYMEAWIYHFGRDAMDKEDWCDLFGLAMTQFVLDLMQTLRLEPQRWASGMWPAAPEPTPSEDADTPTTPPPANPKPRTPKAPRTRRHHAVRVFRVADADPGGRLAPATSTDGDRNDATTDDVARWKTRVFETLKRGLRDAEDA